MEQAEQVDLQARADAARKGGKSHPKATAGRAREELAVAQANAAALAKATSDAEADLLAKVEQHREEYARKLDAEVEERRERSLEAARRLGELEADRARVMALRRWLGAARFLPDKSPPLAIDLRQPSGERYTLAEVLPLIEAALAPVEPEKEAELPQRLARVTR